MSIKTLLRAITFVCVLLLLASPAIAQVTTADAVGHVSDPNGLAVAGAKITVSSASTGFRREAFSSDTGDFSVVQIPPGTYHITVEKSGFSTAVYDAVELAVEQKRTLDVTLKVGSSSTTVMVTEETPLVDTTSSEIKGSVTPLEVRGLPVVDRNFAGLMSLVPGVRPAENFDPTKTRSGNVTINGSDGRAIDYNVDGGDNKDNVIGGLVQNFTMEGIQEFSVVTDRYSADSGRAVGAIVNVISKSGTNEYHGTAFGLFQNSGLSAEDHFAAVQKLSKPKFHRYQYGGSFGGPVMRDKLFVFGAMENKREPGNIAVNQTAFNELTTLHTQFPNLSSPITNLPFPYIDWLVTVRGDWKITDKQTAFIRYAREKWTNPNDQLGNPFVTDLSQSNGDTNQFHSLVISHNYVLTPTKINTFSVQFQDFVNAISASPGHTFTIPTQNGGVATNPEICFRVVPGCGGGGAEVEVGQNVNVPQQTLIRKYQFRDDFSWIMGRHNMKVGANYIYLAKLGGFFFFGANGYQLTFWDYPSVILANPGTYPQGLATPGAVEELTFNTGSGNTAQPPAHEIGLYYQDDFKVSQHLTLNLGLRWDANPSFLTPQLTTNPLTTNRAIAVLNQVLAANPSAARDAQGMAFVRSIVGDQGLLRKTATDWKEFQPRVGFAWDPYGTGKLIIRGGYGIARDQIFQNLTLFAIQQEQPTLYQTVIDLLANGRGTNCVPAAGGTPATDLCRFRFGTDPLPSSAASPSQLGAGSTGRIIDPRITDPWAQQASLGAAVQLSNDYAFSADFYHVFGTHEPRVIQMNEKLASLCNAAFPGANPGDPRCVNAKDVASTRLLDAVFLDSGLGIGRLSELRMYGTTNRSFFDSLNLQVKKRFTGHFTFQASDVVSWSNSWGGRATSSYSGSGVNITPERQFLTGEFGPTEFDERNRFTASGIFQFFHGFEIAPIFTWATPRPFNALAGQDLDGDGRSTIDRACLTGPPAKGCPEFTVNAFRGKSFIQGDMRTSYAFKLRENMDFRIIWEFYNLFNRTNSCNNVDQTFYAGAARSTTFGKAVGYCGGQGFGAGFSNAYRSQFGFRFEF